MEFCKSLAAIKSKKRFALDTGAGFNIIRRNSLPYCWKKGVNEAAILPGPNDANVNPSELGDFFLLTTELGNTVFKIRYILAKRLAVDAIISTAFMNRHVVSIRGREQKLEFPR